jgi:predicted nucleotidyltransferase component of viral defense system
MNRYPSDAAFRMALEERLRQRAGQEGEPLIRLRKRLVFERCMVRLQKNDHSPWVLKGGFALELRLGNAARMTKDLDLAFDVGQFDQKLASLSEITEKLREDLHIDNEDRFSFAVRQGSEEELPTQGVKSYRFGLEVRLDGRLFEMITIDVGVGDPIIPPTDQIKGSDILAFAGVPAPLIRVTSTAQHFAEKMHALTRPFDERINTRVKDLGDLMLMMDRGLPAPNVVAAAVNRVYSSRNTHPIPQSIEAPLTWATSYTAMAQGLNLGHTTIESAVSRLNSYWKTIF